MSEFKRFIKSFVFDPEGPERVSRPGRPSPSLVRAGANLWGKVTDAWFNTRVEGAHHIPRKGPAIVVANHGFLAGESNVLYNAIVRKSGRVPRAVAAHFIWKFPTAGRIARAFGAVKGDRDQVRQLLEQGELLMIYPGGVREAAKGPEDRQRLFWEGRTGFIKVALEAGAPIIPVGILGADDLYWRSDLRLDFVARLTGDKDASAPVFWGLGPLPLPVSLKIRFGEPIPMEGGLEAAGDDARVEALQAKVKAAVEALLLEPDAAGFGAVEESEDDGEGGGALETSTS